ncbi:hypothetical protein NQ314_017952 [Rhamnusium bicolor]|uniref:THAP-type domain-containing protein n=1 Tax=Rhamnusium bicolor TaxID=1586634 RepID=A0AAV8WSF9_9CUCU|nr:hypothetical protein NQ314_017952 [Rhamnusium bicolor]
MDPAVERIPAVLKGRGEKLEAVSKEQRICWVRSLKRGELSETFLKNARICSNHFITGQPAELEDKDNPDWIPSQNVGYTSINTKDQEAIETHSRIANRRKRLKMIQMFDESASMQEVVEPVAGPSTSMEYSEEEGSSGVEVQTEMGMDHLNKVFSDLNFCNEKIHALQKQLKAMDLSEESFLNNDLKALYFTVFPNADK